MRFATLLAILIIVIMASYSITFRPGDVATMMMVMLASAIATDVVCLLLVSATGLVARLQLVLRFG